MTDTTEEPKETFHEQEKKDLEKERKKEVVSYVRTYIRTLRDSLSSISPDVQDLHKVHLTLSMDESVRDVAKFLAPLLHTDMSSLFAEAFLKELESLASRLPDNIVFNIVHQLPIPKDTTDDMLELEVDLVSEKLHSLQKSIAGQDKIPRHLEQERKKYLVEQLEKHLSKAIKVARRSKSLEFQKLVIDTREILRSHAAWKTIVQIVQRRVD